MGIDLVAYPIRAETGVLRDRREAYAFDMQEKPSTDAVLEGLMNGSRVSFDEIRRARHGAIFDDADVRVTAGDDDCGDRLDVGNPDMMEELAAVLREQGLPPGGAPGTTTW